MPIDFRILNAQGLVLCRAWEFVDDEDFRDHHEALTGHEAFHPSLDQLFDLQGVTELEVTTEALRELARRNPFGAGARRAIVIAPGNPLTFGLARMYQGYAAEDPDRLVVQFDHVEGALDWLGVEPRVLDAMPGP